MRLIFCNGCEMWIALDTLQQLPIARTDEISKEPYYVFACPSCHTELIREYRMSTAKGKYTRVIGKCQDCGREEPLYPTNPMGKDSRSLCLRCIIKWRKQETTKDACSA